MTKYDTKLKRLCQLYTHRNKLTDALLSEIYSVLAEQSLRGNSANGNFIDL